MLLSAYWLYLCFVSCHLFLFVFSLSSNVTIYANLGCSIAVVESSTKKNAFQCTESSTYFEQIIFSWFNEQEFTSEWRNAKFSDVVYMRDITDSYVPLKRKTGTNSNSWWPLQFSALKTHQTQEFIIFYAGRSFHGLRDRLSVKQARVLDQEILNQLFMPNKGMNYCSAQYFDVICSYLIIYMHIACSPTPPFIFSNAGCLAQWEVLPIAKRPKLPVARPRSDSYTSYNVEDSARLLARSRRHTSLFDQTGISSFGSSVFGDGDSQFDTEHSTRMMHTFECKIGVLDIPLYTTLDSIEHNFLSDRQIVHMGWKQFLQQSGDICECDNLYIRITRTQKQRASQLLWHASDAVFIYAAWLPTNRTRKIFIRTDESGEPITEDPFTFHVYKHALYSNPDSHLSGKSSRLEPHSPTHSHSHAQANAQTNNSAVLRDLRSFLSQEFIDIPDGTSEPTTMLSAMPTERNVTMGPTNIGNNATSIFPTFSPSHLPSSFPTPLPTALPTVKNETAKNDHKKKKQKVMNMKLKWFLILIIILGVLIIITIVICFAYRYKIIVSRKCAATLSETESEIGVVIRHSFKHNLDNTISFDDIED